ncbi:MAG: hypothetical protein V5B78_07800 [Desulfohalobiaceae bacterium]
MAEMSLEDLNLKKPLDKMTAKELRELAIEKIPQIKGASGMEKHELIKEIKELCGILEDAENPYKEQIWSIKREIKELKAQKAQLPSSRRKQRDRLRRQIKRLKNRTRRLAEAV